MGNIDIEACYTRYAPMIFRRCMGILRNEDEALDAAQDVFVKLLTHQNTLHGQFLSSLLYIMATNTCLNLLRQRKRQGSVNQDPEPLFPAIQDREYEKIEARILMDALMEQESESTRAICFLYHGDGMSLKEIGKLMGLSVSGVRKRLTTFKARAIQKWEGEKL
ncbi:MAG: sigma-70 family RNA polymerase sigma factor [Treponema sp.]|nr:sigma-70 family RNA polymerase sigma factor [Treponema sp.]